jgi:hypothetical protein
VANYTHIDFDVTIKGGPDAKEDLLDFIMEWCSSNSVDIVRDDALVELGLDEYVDFNGCLHGVGDAEPNWNLLGDLCTEGFLDGNATIVIYRHNHDDLVIWVCDGVAWTCSSGEDAIDAIRRGMLGS